MQKYAYHHFALLGAWLIALCATLVTLYISEILQIPPCPLCWYQRIGLYPLSIVLGIAAYRDDYQIYIYAIPLAAIAALFAGYQYLEQMIPGFSPIHFCNAQSAIDSCSQKNWQWFGFITLPLLSLLANASIIILLLLSRHRRPATQKSIH